MRKLVAVLVLFFSFGAPLFSYAINFGTGDSGLEQTGSTGYGSDWIANDNIATYIGSYIIAPLLGILGLMFFCLMVYAGFLWMTAAGDEKKIAKAKNILTSSVIGAVIIVASYALTTAFVNALSTGSIVGSG